jgi:hypothetical protein
VGLPLLLPRRWLTALLAIALVLSNWHNVLRAINMASGTPSTVLAVLSSVSPVRLKWKQRNSRSPAQNPRMGGRCLFPRHSFGYQQSMRLHFKRTQTQLPRTSPGDAHEAANPENSNRGFTIKCLIL